MDWKRFASEGTVGWHKGDGKLLALVLHGGPGLSDYTAELCEEVLSGGNGQLRVARYQQRGAPPSSTEGPITVEQLVADAVAVLDHFEAPSALLIGHSWGGHLALHIAVARPDRVQGLLLLDSLAAVGDGGTGTMSAVIHGRIGERAVAEIASLAERDDLGDDERGARQLALMWPGYFRDAASASPMPAITAHSLAGTVMADATRLLAERVLEEALPSLDVPSLHLIGAHSPIEPAANERTAALMRDAMVEVHDIGHFAWLEEPGSVAAATRRLLDVMAMRVA